MRAVWLVLLLVGAAAPLALLAPSLRRAPVAEIERMLGLYRDIYRSFTVKHFHEQLVKRHNYVLGYTVTKLHLHREGLVQKAKKRSAHRKEAATAANGGDDAPPGRFDACLAARGPAPV